MAVTRNLKAEQLAIKSVMAGGGKLPDIYNNPAVRAQVYKIAYPPSAGGLPDELKGTVDESLYSGTGTTPQSANIATSSAPMALAGNVEAARTATEGPYSATARNEYGRVLQDAIRRSTGYTAQKVKLGESEAFKQAGLGGYNVLSQSLASHGTEMINSAGELERIVNDLTGAYKAGAEEATTRYKTAVDEYQFEADRLAKIAERAEDYANQVKLNQQSADLQQKQSVLNAKIAGTLGAVDYVTPEGNIIKGGGSISFQHNNPLNIKFAEWERQYGAVAGKESTDGGRFAYFPTVEAGFQAAKDLLRGKYYNNLTLDAAMKKWSNGGYGESVTAKQLWGKKMNQLTDQELQGLMEDMQRREGWTEATITRTEYSEKNMVAAQAIMKPFSTMKLADLPQKDRAGVSAALNVLKQQALDSGDEYAFLKTSAGGTTLPQTAVENIAKFSTAIDSLSALKSEVDNFKAKDGTGPFKGRINDLKFWDADVETIRAKLTAVVPTIARGVFGEVGVLTDNDINTYKQVIPNIKTPREAVDRIYQGLLETIKNKILNTYTGYANAGYDVSGSAEYFKKLKDQVDKELGIQGTIKLQDPKTGIVKIFINMTTKDIEDAKKQGYKIIE